MGEENGKQSIENICPMRGREACQAVQGEALLARGDPQPHPGGPGHMLPAGTLGLSKDAGVSHASYVRACSLRRPEPWFSRESLQAPEGPNCALMPPLRPLQDVSACLGTCFDLPGDSCSCSPFCLLPPYLTHEFPSIRLLWSSLTP